MCYCITRQVLSSGKPRKKRDLLLKRCKPCETAETEGICLSRLLIYDMDDIKITHFFDSYKIFPMKSLKKQEL